MPGVSIAVSVLIGLFFSILFIQSGLDKLFNSSAELAFYKQHFSKTFLKPLVPVMYGVLTLLEISSGFISAVSVYMLLQNKNAEYAFYANCLCASALLCLFFGQRIAKDYGGAQSLVSYFIVALLGIYLTR